MKHSRADDSVGFPHVKVGHCQGFIVRSGLIAAFFLPFFCYGKSLNCFIIKYKKIPFLNVAQKELTCFLISKLLKVKMEKTLLLLGLVNIEISPFFIFSIPS